jgi:hypothetical protein
MTDAGIGEAHAEGRATREMVHARTCELALLNRRNGGTVCQADYEQAKWELLGEREGVAPLGK